MQKNRTNLSENTPTNQNESKNSDNLENGNIVLETEKTAYSLFKFARFTTEFSKWVSLVLVLCWVVTLFLGWISFFISGTYPIDVLDYVKDPMLVVLGFYYGTKMVENVSKGVCRYLYKKLGLPQEDESSFSTDGSETFPNTITKTEINSVFGNDESDNTKE